MHGSAAIGLTQIAAPTTRSAVTHAIDVSGMANLTGPRERVDVSGGA